MLFEVFSRPLALPANRRPLCVRAGPALPDLKPSMVAVAAPDQAFPWRWRQHNVRAGNYGAATSRWCRRHRPFSLQVQLDGATAAAADMTASHANTNNIRLNRRTAPHSERLILMLGDSFDPPPRSQSVACSIDWPEDQYCTTEKLFSMANEARNKHAS